MNLKKYLRPGDKASDITPLLAERNAFKNLIDSLAKLFEDTKFEKVVCIEGRGFIIGSAVAYKLNKGLILARIPGKLKNTYSEKYTDYSGKEKTLEMLKDAITKDERVVIVDDWLETGETVNSTIRLVEKCGGKVVGVGIFMDDSSKFTKAKLTRYNYRFLESVTKGDNF